MTPIVEITLVDGLQFDVDKVIDDATRVLVALDLSATELSILLCDDATIHPLNLAWRGKDKPTDVLSFSQEDGLVLGDVVISLQTAQRQADERGHGLDHEVRVLLVHGICHLIGHDHERDDEAEVMEALERDLLARLGTNAR